MAQLRFRIDKTAKAGTRVTQRYCNLSCIWCHHDFFEHDGYRAISNNDFISEVKRIIAVTNTNGVFVRIAGDGDPTVVGGDELSDLVRKLKSVPQVQKVTLTTNGVLLNNKMVSQLKNAGIDGITISLNSLRNKQYSYYAGSNHLNDVIGSIELVYLAQIPLKINTIYWKGNEEEIDLFEDISAKYGGMPIKFFDLLSNSELTRSLYLPLKKLEEEIYNRAVMVNDISWPYAKRIYQLQSGAVFIIKVAGQVNNCPNLACFARDTCLEGCRSSIRLGLDGSMKPCGVRNDNIVYLNAEQNVTDETIWNALHSGGKVGW